MVTGNESSHSRFIHIKIWTCLYLVNVIEAPPQKKKLFNVRMNGGYKNET